MRRWVVAMLGYFMLWGPAAWAVDIQYALSDSRVTGVSDTPLSSVTGYGLITLVGALAADIQWPVPPGCPTGDPAWTLVTNPATVAVDGTGLGVRSGLSLFHTTSPLLTGCRQVGTWRELEALLNTLLLDAIPDRVASSGVGGHWTWYQSKCYDAPQNAQCQAWLANLVIMLQIVPGRGQGVTISGQGATLITDALSFKNAQCTAQPGGPFC